MNQLRSAGFTLIELMVVIAIIGVLAAALLPRVIESQESAYQAADQQNLRWHYDNLLEYKRRYKSAPRFGGSQFVIAPWVRGCCERTKANFERYFVPGYEDPHSETLMMDIGVDEVWKTIDDVSSIDTHYAGRARSHLAGKIFSGKQPLMANDNETGAVFLNQTIHVLMGDRSIVELLYDPHLMELGYEGDGIETWFEVGPDSPHKLLQKLEK